MRFATYSLYQNSGSFGDRPASKGDWDATDVEWFSFHYKQSKFIFISPAPGVTRKRADISEDTESVHADIHPVYRGELANRGMSRNFAELASHLLLEKCDDYTEYSMLDEQDRVSGYRNRPVASERAQENITSAANPNIDNLLKGVDDDDDLDFDGAIDVESAQRDCVKRYLQDLQTSVGRRNERFR